MTMSTVGDHLRLLKRLARSMSPWRTRGNWQASKIIAVAFVDPVWNAAGGGVNGRERRSTGVVTAGSERAATIRSRVSFGTPDSEGALTPSWNFLFSVEEESGASSVPWVAGRGRDA